MNNLVDIMIQVPLREQLRRIAMGLSAPKDSGEYRYACDSLLCMFGPTTLSMVGSITIACCALFIEIKDPPRINRVTITTTIDDPIITKLDPPIIDAVKPEDMKPLVPDDPNMKPNEAVGEFTGVEWAGTPDEFSTGESGSGNGVNGDMDIPTIRNAVVLTTSSHVIRGLAANRSKEGREKAFRLIGGKEGAGSKATEGAVLMSLRWLKKNQQADGSWASCKPAMTGLAILTYLAHGETPATSKEFGLTVEKGIKWLVDNQEQNGLFKGRDANNYSHPIATYALCEAYGMIQIPVLKAAAEKAVDCIIKGQHASGGWNYNLNAEDRDDTSYMGWCAQALKAAKIANLENEGLQEAVKRTVHGFKKNYDPSGSFGYTGPQAGSGLTGVGVLCLQLFGSARDAECRNAVLWLEKSATFDWDKPWLTNPIYYWYYVTQTKFHAGGDIWNKWNKQFSVALVNSQKIEKGAIDGPGGRKCDIGYWEPPAGVKGHSDGPVQDTCLCALQLEVYYRTLPTYRPVVPDDENMKDKEDTSELKVTTIASVITR